MNRIAELRKERGLNQEELGAFVGKTKYAISKWESGTNEPSQDDMTTMCEILGADSDYLMGRTNINTRRIELNGQQIPPNLREAGLTYVQMLREYVDQSGGILPEVQQELLRLLSEAKVLQGKPQKKQQ